MSASVRRGPPRAWTALSLPEKVKTCGYAVSVVSVVLLGVVSWRSAAREPLLAVCLVAGCATSVAGMALRWFSYELESK